MPVPLVTVSEDLGDIKAVVAIGSGGRVLVLRGRVPGLDGYYDAVRVDYNGGSYRVWLIRRGRVDYLDVTWLGLVATFLRRVDIIRLLLDYMLDQPPLEWGAKP
jgi:hypothetical protein